MVWPPGYPAPLASDVVVDGGIFVPRRGLDRYAVLPASGVRHVAVLGDSISQGTAVYGGTTGGYFDSWVDRFARSLGESIGPLVGIGFQGLWRSANAFGYANTAGEWTTAGAWVQLVAGNAANLVPFRSAVFATGAAANVLTWTPRAAQAARVVGDAVTRNGVTAVLPASNGVALASFAGAGVLNVGDTTLFDAVGFARITSTGGLLLGFISYTGKTATTLTGCTVLATSSLFTLATGNVVDNVTIVTSASAAFVATDVGQGLYGTNINRNEHVSQVLNGTTIATNRPALAAGSAQVLGLSGRVVMGPIAQVDVYYVDQIGAAQFSTSIDGGGTWQNSPVMTNPGTSQLKKFSVACTNPANFQIRAANAAGVGAACIIAGIAPYSVATPAAGVVVHNLTRDGGFLDASGAVIPNNNGFLQGADALRLLDNNGVAANSGSIQPSLVIVFFSNDVGLPSATFTANLSTVLTRVGGYADMLVVLSFEQIRSDATSAAQLAFRNAVKTWCVANNVGYIDTFAAWVAQGDAGVAAASADGLMNLETAPGSLLIHPSLEGHADIAGHVMRTFSTLGAP